MSIDVWPGEAIIDDGVWYPVRIREDLNTRELYVDTKSAARLATMSNVTTRIASETIRQAVGNDGVWLASGTVDGEDTVWLVRRRPGCGCGQTSRRDATVEQLSYLT